MDSNELINFAVFNLIGISLNLVFTIWLFHAKIGKYPEPLPKSKIPKRELREAGFLYVIYTISLICLALLFITFKPTAFSEPYSIEGTLAVIAIFSITGFLIPILFVIRVNKWTAKDLGITTDIQQPRVFVAAVIIIIILLFGKNIFISDPEPAPLLFLVLALYSNIFIEEFFFRGIIQSKFERVMSQKQSWIWMGIVFGLIHIPSNILGSLSQESDIGIVLILNMFALINQIISGWFFGILYMKTRNLIPPIFVHYINNYLMIILISLL
jgi:membrane protease YdiL (CAAX protease family)